MRARNLKPSLFVNELLAFAHPLHTIIFAGLWCIADRNGLLEDRPQRVHTLINPGRSLSSTKRSLSWLEQNDFIVRYEAENIRVIKVLNFVKHQNPHRDEKPSQLPDYGASTMPAPCSNCASTVSAEKSPESLGLIPSSLIPDSGFLTPDPPTRKHRAAHGGVWNGNKSRSGWTPPKTQDEIEREEAARDANG